MVHAIIIIVILCLPFLLSLSLAFITSLTKVSLNPLHILIY